MVRMASLGGDVVKRPNHGIINGTGGGREGDGEAEDGEAEEGGSLVVEIGLVHISLPPKLSRVIRLYNKEARIPFATSDQQIKPKNSDPISKVPDHMRVRDAGYPEAQLRHDYKGLAGVHKTRRKLPELPTDPKLSIFNNIQKLGVLEAELDVKKLEFKIRKQRQKVAEEFRRMTPEQRQELVSESPYLQKQIHRAIRSRLPFTGSEASSTLLDLRDETTSCSSNSDSCVTPSQPPPHPCKPPRHSPYLKAAELASSEGSSETPKSPSSISPSPLISESEDELKSVCSTPDAFTTPLSTPFVRHPTSVSSSDENHRHEAAAAVSSNYPVPCSVDSANNTDPDHLLEEEIQRVANEIIRHNISTSLERLASGSASDSAAADLTNVSSLPPPPPSLSESTRDDDLNTTLSESDVPSRTVLSDSVVNQINVTPPPPKPHRSEMCTPLSFSDSNLSKRRPVPPPPTDIAPPEKTQSLPGNIDTISTDVSDILSKKFRKQHDPSNAPDTYSSKSISDKLEEIQSKLSPRSFLNSSNTSVKSYTLSYDSLLLDPLLDTPPSDTDVSFQDIATVLNFKDAEEDFVRKMNDKNEKENIVPTAAEIPMDEKEENKIEQIIERLISAVLDDLITIQANTINQTPPPPPYTSQPEIAWNVPHTEAEITAISTSCVEYYVSCIKCGKTIDINSLPDVPPWGSVNIPNFHAFVREIRTVSLELLLSFCSKWSLLLPSSSTPPWIRDSVAPPAPHWMLARTTEPSLDTTIDIVPREVLRILSTSHYSIEAILSKEVIEEDPTWQDFNKDELAWKFRLSDMILSGLISDTAYCLRNIDAKRHRTTIKSDSVQRVRTKSL